MGEESDVFPKEKKMSVCCALDSLAKNGMAFGGPGLCRPEGERGTWWDLCFLEGGSKWDDVIPPLVFFSCTRSFYGTPLPLIVG